MPTRAAPTFTYDRRGWLRAREKIHGMRERAGNVQAAWNTFLDWFTDNNREQFGTQGKRWRTPWRELKPASVRQKRYDGWTGDILVRETRLLRSVSDRPMGIERVGPHDMVGGSNLDYAAHHHFGAPRARIPKRPLWSVPQIRREGAMNSAIKTWIVSGRSRINGSKRKGL